MIKNILVPIDGSAHSKKALEFACELANRFAASLMLVTVVPEEVGEKVVLAFGRAKAVVPADQKDIEKAGRSVIDAARELVESYGCQVSRADVVAGSVGKEILAVAEQANADTIVIGSRGLSDIGGLLLGSVSHKVCHLAGCTCIVVR